MATRKSSVVPAMPEPRSIDVGGVATRYYEAGSGEPIVFIYGGNFGSPDSASSASIWSLNLMPLAKRFRVIAFDKLGQGYTANPLRDEDYTMSAVVAHAAGFIEALKLPPVHVVGHSRGGYAAARLTLLHQHLIRSLTIVNSGTLSPGVSTNDVVLGRAPFPAYSKDSARWIYQRYSFDPEVVTDEWIDACHGVMAQPKYRDSVRKMVDEQLGLRLFVPELAHQKRETFAWIADGRLQRPVQIIWGFDDRTAAVDGGLDLFHMIARHERRTSFNIINQSGHFPYREHPGRFNALLGEFAAATGG